MTYKPVVYESADEATVIYDSGRCDVYTTDTSGLAADEAPWATRKITLSCPKLSPKNRWDRQFARVTSSGATSFAGLFLP